MTFEVSRDGTTGTWSLSWKRHVFVALGLTLVVSGFATVTGPWWQGILTALLGKADIVVNDSYQWLLGAVQVLMGLALLAYKHFIADAQQARLALDKKTLSGGGLYIESVRSYLADLVDDHSYKSSFDTDFVRSSTQFLKPDFKLQVEATATSYRTYAEQAAELRTFVGTYFFVFPPGRPADGDYKYCLMPHHNMDREMVVYDAAKVAEYDRLKLELHAKTAATQSAFDQLVTRLKSLGCV